MSNTAGLPTGGHARGASCVNFKPPCREGTWDKSLPYHTIDADAPADDVEG